MMRKKNIYSSDSLVSSKMRKDLLKHEGCVLWLTGLSGAGKSTVARELEKKLFSFGCMAYILDGDNMRCGLCSDLGFSDEDRAENIRRIGEVAALFANAGVIAITAFIAPFEEGRRKARARVAPGKFIEVYISAPLSVCEQRDPKGLYRKAREGEIQDFTGIDSAYEVPRNPEIVIDSASVSPEDAADIIIDYIKDKNII